MVYSEGVGMYRFLLAGNYLWPSNVKVFTLLEKPDRSVSKNIIEGFIEDAVCRGSTVEWYANKNNSILQYYQDIVKSFNGSWRPEVGVSEVLHFFAPREDSVEGELEVDWDSEEGSSVGSIVDGAAETALLGRKIRVLGDKERGDIRSIAGKKELRQRVVSSIKQSGLYWFEDGSGGYCIQLGGEDRKRNPIRWSALKTNETCDQYDRAVEAYGGERTENKKDSSLWDYTIPKGSMFRGFSSKHEGFVSGGERGVVGFKDKEESGVVSRSVLLDKKDVMGGRGFGQSGKDTAGGVGLGEKELRQRVVSSMRQSGLYWFEDGSGMVKVDTRLAERSLPDEEQVKYAGEDDVSAEGVDGEV